MNKSKINSILDKKAIIDGFNRASTSYDQHAILQREISSRLLERLEWIKIKPKVIIDLGGGTGDVAIHLAKRYPDAQIYMIDIAQQMLQIAKQKQSNKAVLNNQSLFNKIKAKLTNKKHNIHYICGDAENIPIKNQKIDLIVSNLAIQWCQNTQQLFNDLQRILRPSGCLLFSTFGVDTLTELKQSWANVSSKPHVNNFTDMHELGDAMLLSGLDDPVMDSEIIVMEYTKLIDLFKDLKKIGAHNHLQQRSKSLTTKTTFKEMQLAYENFKLNNGKYPASYEVVYGHGWGKELKVGIKKFKKNTQVQPINFIKHH
jgi:malonyl-CoA O-methyltransferase